VRFSLILLLLVCCLAACTAAPGTKDDYTLYLVRHAEKQADGSRDPELTGAGRRRSENLSEWLADKDIRDVWSSDYKRTRDTARPTLSRLGLDLIIYDPRDLTTLSATLLSNQKNALVVGHSNTTPELARLLCTCDIDDMDDSEYDRLIVISILDGEPHAKTITQQVNPHN